MGLKAIVLPRRKGEGGEGGEREREREADKRHLPFDYYHSESNHHTSKQTNLHKCKSHKDYTLHVHQSEQYCMILYNSYVVAWVGTNIQQLGSSLAEAYNYKDTNAFQEARKEV